MIWFLKSKEDFVIRKKELSLSDHEIQKLVDQSQPRNIWQALMQAAPGDQLKIPADEPYVIREALLDCMEMLTDEDRYVIDAIIWEQTGYSELARRLGVSTPHAWRLTQAAFANLKEFLFMHSTLREYVINGE
jgi:DNA-directed RNA polymerase specialized sigma24 family protein